MLFYLHICSKIMNNLPSLIYHFGRVVEYLFYGNTILFLDDIKGKMIDLEYTLSETSVLCDSH